MVTPWECLHLFGYIVKTEELMVMPQKPFQRMWLSKEGFKDLCVHWPHGKISHWEISHSGVIGCVFAKHLVCCRPYALCWVKIAWLLLPRAYTCAWEDRGIRHFVVPH